MGMRHFSDFTSSGPARYAPDRVSRQMEDFAMKQIKQRMPQMKLSRPSVTFSREVLEDFKKNVGRYAPETGGMMGCTTDPARTDLCQFDRLSRHTTGTFYYDVESMTKVFHSWSAKGYRVTGIYHSHPLHCIRPSYHDLSTALIHIRFFEQDFFYLPIFQPAGKGLFTMYFYIVRLAEDTLTVTLDHVLKAARDHRYKLLPFVPWSKAYSVAEMDQYRASLEAEQAPEKQPDAAEPAQSGAARPAEPGEGPDYFAKVREIFPEQVMKQKVIVCIGTGGARSFLENCARCGVQNFLLMDGDVVSPSNVATQGVFVSEMGKQKVSVIRDQILDINPQANVHCVPLFLDDAVSDADFKAYLDAFPGRKPTDYLILGCTDNFEAQKRSSMLALKYGTLYLAAMMYAKGAAAELLYLYPGVTESCPRCMLRSRYEQYEAGFQNDVDSASCSIFATERMNATKGQLAMMLLLYHQAPSSPFNDMLDGVKDRNFLWIRLSPHLNDALGIDLFDRVFAGNANRFAYMDETLWIPQHPDRPEFGEEACKMCGGTGDLRHLQTDWADRDTRSIRFDG